MKPTFEEWLMQRGYPAYWAKPPATSFTEVITDLIRLMSEYLQEHHS